MALVVLKKPKSKMHNNAGVSGGPAPGTQYLTLKQVAALLQVCTKTVRRLIREKGIPVTRVGRQIRIFPEHVALFASKEW
jgi:excisionase family DNA binding protein